MKRYEPTVSIIVPAYNEEKHIRKCLDSLMAIDYPKEKLEIIVVDNCSTDKTREIVAGYPVRLIVENKRNASAARNTGILAAGGKIILNTDADCVADSRLVKEIVKPFADDGITGVGGKIESAAPETPAQEYAEKAHVLDQKDVFLKTMRPGFIQTANAAYRKKALMEIGLFDEKLRNCSDSDIAYRLQWAGHKIVLGEKAVVRHIHRETIWQLYRQFYSYSRGRAGILAKHRKMLGKNYRIDLKKYFALAGMLFLAIPALIFGKNSGEKLYPIYGAARWLGTITGTLQGAVENRMILI